MDSTESNTSEPPPSTTHSERLFEDESVALDFNEFVECRFENCELIFHGEGPFGFEECEFNECDWGFAGSAALTLHFLATMHEHGNTLQDIVEDVINEIRGGGQE